MLDKLFKIAVISIAMLGLGFTIKYLLTPTQSIAQMAKNGVSNIVPESHEWEVCASNSNVFGYALVNKKSGELYIYQSNLSNPFVKLK